MVFVAVNYQGDRAMQRPDDKHLLGAALDGNALMRLLLLGADLKSIEFSLNDFEHARVLMVAPRHEFVGVDPNVMSLTFHHAKIFVCAVRRFARLLEAARNRRSEYPPMVARVLDREWRAHRVFFDQYREPRDAIEHIDGEVTRTNHRFLNLANDRFEVVDGRGVAVNRDALGAASSIWRAIVDQAERTADARGPRGSIVRLLAVLRLRAGAAG